METINLVMCVDEKYVQHLAVTIVSILETKKSIFPVAFHIVTCDFTKDSELRLQEITGKYGAAINFYYMDEKAYADLIMFPIYSKVIYYRLMIDKILPDNISKIIYLDSDLVALKDITELWQTDISAYCLAAVVDTFLDDNSTGHKTKLGLGASRYLNSGVLIINIKKWRAEKVGERVIQYVKDHAEIIQFPDQDALNVVLKGQWLMLSPKWNMQSSMMEKVYLTLKVEDWDLVKSVVNPALVHFTALKPWSYMCINPYAAVYYKYLKMTHWKGYRAPDLTVKNVCNKLKWLLVAYPVYTLSRLRLILLMRKWK